MHKLTTRKRHVENNYSLALLSVKIWPVTFGSTMIKLKGKITQILFTRNTPCVLPACVSFGYPIMILTAEFNAAQCK